MPMPLFGLPIAPFPIQQSPATTVQKQVTEANGLRIEFGEAVGSFTDRNHTYSGGVKATYDVTTITCDTLIIDEANRVGRAKGNVVLTDPEGTVTCNDLEFHWLKKGEEADPKTLLGNALNVKIKTGNVRLSGASLEIYKNNWVMKDATGTLSRRENPEWKLTARRVSIVPGKSGVAEHLTINILGLKVGPIPRYSFSLDRRLKGFSLPSVRSEQGKGIGFAWGGNFLLGDKGILTTSWSSFPQKKPTWSLEYTYTTVDPEKVRKLALPRSDLGDRFSDSFFENVGVPNFENEFRDLIEEKNSFSIASKWNQSVTGRETETDRISKALEVTFERGGPVAGMGSRFQGRLQHIRGTEQEAFRSRAVGIGTVVPKPIQLSPQLSFQLRGDAFASVGEKTAFSWFRGQAGLVYSPAKTLSLSAAYSNGVEIGTPDFVFDRLGQKESLNLRLDWKSGPYTFRYLTKYDFNLNKIYDREYEVAWQWGSFEPFVLYRQNPSDYRIGFRFLLGDFGEHLSNRKIERKKK